MRQRSFLIAALASVALFIAAPVWADWTADDAELAEDGDQGTPSSGGAVSHTGHPGGGYFEAYCETAGSLSYAGLTWNVTRQYWKNSTPGSRTITLSIGVSGSAHASQTSGGPSTTAYADARSIGHGDSSSFPTGGTFDKQATANAPSAKQSDSYADDTSNYTPTTATISVDTVLGANAYANATGGGNGGLWDADAVTQIGLSDP